MFEIERDADGVMRLTGRFDASEVHQAQQAFRAVHEPLTVDFAGVEYISSAGIAVLIETYKRLNAAGHAFTLVRMQPRVRNVFAYAGLDKLLRIE